ncbi:MAG: DNA repair protein RecO [Gammaproteobacteria bacterium]|nr:DNA repair protein RecO [Gammaproteobacteria bacterium]
MRISLQPAFVLHLRPYRETSVLLDLLTLDHGRISLVARGVRQNKSRLRPILQPFLPLLVSWQGKGDLGTLLTVEPNGYPTRLIGECLLSGLYLNELLMRVLHKHDPYPQLYTIYQGTLLELQGAKVEEKRLRLFEKKLLEEVGYGLRLDCEVSSQKPLEAENDYHFLPEHGFELASESSHIATSFSGKSLLALAREELEDEICLRDAKRLMRLALAPLLGQSRLYSRQLFMRKVKVSSDE